jgi:hypothetical protein
VRFYLGTHQPGHLARAGIPLFVSRRRLVDYKTLPRAAAPWALDSGGFTELQMHGRWTLTAAEYAREVRRYRDEVGRLEWAAPQDWMCEPAVIAGGKMGLVRFVGTGLSVLEHQRRTVENLLELRAIAPDLPWAPVLQGWDRRDYDRHLDMYDVAGVDLTCESLVGVGSICRRQHTREAAALLYGLAAQGLRLHGFGLKLKGIDAAAEALTSADSMAWSYAARRADPLPGCTTHKNCANCLRYALLWRDQVECRIIHHRARRTQCALAL